jgi:thioredoxin reductase (NADPH)
MSGIEFLEAAMDLFPLARRVLLTAYADTDAAIQAINVVDLDHYLLKPWNPPEEKLYPVVDAMLDLWKETPEPSTDETKVIGHRWSAPSFAARDFLARNAVPYRWFSVDDDESQRTARRGWHRRVHPARGDHPGRDGDGGAERG